MSRASWIIVSVTFALCAIIGFFWTRPVIMSDLSALEQTQKAKDELTAATQKKEALAQLKDNDQLAKLNAIAVKYIPEEANSSELVLELTGMANQNKLTVDSFSLTNQAAATPAASDDPTATKTAAPAKTTGPGGSQEVGFSMTVSGSFLDFLNFLKNSESSSRLVSLQTMGLNQSEGQGTVKFTANLAGKAYYKKGSSLAADLANIQISTDTIAKFQNLKTFSTPINLPAEAGFGRTNPFETVK